MTVINAPALKPRFKIGFSPSASVGTPDELFALNWRRPPQRAGHANTPPRRRYVHATVKTILH